MPTTAVPRERLSRDRVVEAALAIMDAEGLDAVTMRRVARDVGVEAMSLYHYVQDKDDLLDGVCARVMQDFRYPDEDRPWIEVARDGAREWRRVLADASQRHGGLGRSPATHDRPRGPDARWSSRSA